MNQQAPSPPEPSETPEPPDPSVAATNPFPSHRDLYILVAGIVLGVLLSSAVLGRIAPSVYDRMFVGSGDARQQLRLLNDELEALDAEQIELAEKYEQSGATATAFQEELDRIEQQRQNLQRQQQTLHQQMAVSQAQAASRHTTVMTAMVLALIAVMIIEPLVAPQPIGRGRAVVSPASSRLITIRYALIALWIALAIAQPAVLRDVPLLFTLLLIAVALIAAFVPLGPRGTSPAEPQ